MEDHTGLAGGFEIIREELKLYLDLKIKLKDTAFLDLMKMCCCKCRCRHSNVHPFLKNGKHDLFILRENWKSHISRGLTNTESIRQ